MKRDLDLYRTLLFEMVDAPSSKSNRFFFQDAKEDETVEEYHIDLLIQQGFLKVESERCDPPGPGGSSMKGRRVVRNLCVSVTNSGHDYVDAVRNEGIWNQTKAAVAKAGGSATIEVIKAISVGLLKKQIEKHTGIAL
jgi:hypothetical protein